MSSLADDDEVDMEEDEQKTSQGEGGSESSAEDLDRLQEFGIGVADIKKLKAAGIHTVGGLFMQTKKRLSDIKGLTEAKIQKAFEAAAKIKDVGFVAGSVVLERRKKLVRITTGATALDELLGGGIETGSITEAFGEFRTGKTQLAHTLCVTAQLPHDLNGGNGKVMFIDTEGTFRPDRIVAIADKFEVDANTVLDNIHYARAYTHEHQMDLLVLAAAKMMEEKYALIVVDSATALFRVDFMGRGQLSERQQKLGQFLSHLTKLAEEFGVAVYITNQVVSDPGGSTIPGMADQKKPIGGHIMAHASCTRLMLRKGRGEQRICKIFDSPCLPENEAIFQLSEGGITNAKE